MYGCTTYSSLIILYIVLLSMSTSKLCIHVHDIHVHDEGQKPEKAVQGLHLLSFGTAYLIFSCTTYNVRIHVYIRIWEGVLSFIRVNVFFFS